MSQNPMLLQAHALTLGYGDHMILCDIDFQVHSDEFWFFLGHNGDGKSTLLRAVLGLLSPLSGTLWLHPELESRERHRLCSPALWLESHVTDHRT